MSETKEGVCVVVGVGPGNGEAFARRFLAGGYHVALVSRTQSKLDAMAKEMGEGPHGVAARGFACDAGDPAALDATFGQIAEALGPVDVLLWNAGNAEFGSFEDVTFAQMESAWRLNTLGLHAAAKLVTPEMKKKGRGAIVVTGATASLRGGARFAAFAQAKAAQRSLAQSISRHAGADGVHVALVIVDGLVDTPMARERMPDVPAEKKLKPEAIADSVWHLAHQDPSAWTFELDVRPSHENW
ncbi:MAG: SDR family NAD(P)-dependent oxidoreductase [Myxococcota bacterium]